MTIARAARCRPKSRIAGTGLIVLVLVALLTSCLGPSDPDPTGNNPFGSLDSMVADGDGVRVRGWAIDPSTAEPVTVSAWRDGKRVDAVANLERPDVGQVYPGSGARHGFDFRYGGLAPGTHTICVAVDNVGPGEHTRVLGCADVNVTWSPHGRWDELSVADGRARVAGWARDPDSSAPIQVGVVLDSALVSVVRAGLDASVVPSATDLGAGRGFALEFPAAPGQHEVCVVMGNVGHGVDTWLDCRKLQVPEPAPDRRPVGSLSSVQPASRTSVRVRGSAADPDTTGSVQVSLRVRGAGADRTVTTATGAGGEFDVTVTGLRDGSHSLCPVIGDVATVPSWPGATTGDRVLPCGSAVLGVDGLGTTGAPTLTGSVGPPAGHTNERVDRDGGISVELYDGTVLWLFGDSLERDAAGNDLYFVHNSAALAASSEPAVTRDAVVGGAPVEFVTPSAQHAAAMGCPPDRPVSGLWPMSASAGARTGSTQRVIAFFANMCMGGPGEFEDRGVAVVEWTYRVGSTQPGSVLTGTVIEDFLFDVDSPEWGSASWTRSESGHDMVYGYDCGSPEPTGSVQFPNEWGSCTVGRVAAVDVDDGSAWQWWNGSSWSTDPAAAASMLGIPDPSPTTDSKAPVAAFNVAWDPALDRFVMAYSPWPGYTSEVMLRVARTPTGPWSEPVSIAMSGCQDSIGPVGYFCYAAGAHTALGTPGQIGLGLYDQLVSAAPLRGSYRYTRVPFVVSALG